MNIIEPILFQCKLNPLTMAICAPGSAIESVSYGQLEAFIQREVDDKRLPALSVALVEDQAIVWARGFGFADPAARTPASSASA